MWDPIAEKNKIANQIWKSMKKLELPNIEINDNELNTNEDKIEKSIKEEFDIYKSAIGIVIKERDVLLGTSTIKDDRNGLLVFPGGGIEGGEDIRTAAIREVNEESGVIAEDSGLPMIFDTKKPKIAFVALKYKSGEIKYNKEFSNMSWYSLDNLPKEKMMKQNYEILVKFFDGKTSKKK